MARTSIAGSMLMAAVVIAGCAADTGDESTDSNSEEITAVNCSDVSNTDIRRSLAVTDAAVLAKFPFSRVMTQIRQTANVAASETSAGEFQRWMKTFGSTAGAGDCNDPNIDPNDYGLVCPRPNELELSKVNPFVLRPTVNFVPVALFNRFDLAPGNGANCGEYRIVYAMKSSLQSLQGRAFIIFEATLPNPTPSHGLESCLPVARFWQSLTTDNDVASRTTKLENFYFSGTAVPNFVPVVRAQNYGFSTNAEAPTSGQIRTNFFVDSVEWHLREYKLKRTCSNAAAPGTCKLDFAHVAVSGNPANELFAGTHARSAAFRTAFVTQVPKLAATSVNLIQLSTSDEFNEFESSAQNSNVVYNSSADATIRASIQQKLRGMRSALSVNNILDRATTQTCGGCHQLSNGANLGGGKTWPNSLGFVHVDEASQLSPALTGTFLPKRKATLEKFINDRCNNRGGTATVERVPGDETVGGSSVESPN